MKKTLGMEAERSFVDYVKRKCHFSTATDYVRENTDSTMLRISYF